MPLRCWTTIWLVVTRLLISWPRSTLFCSRNVRSSLAVAEPLSISVRRYASLAATVPENSDRSREKLRIADALVDLGLQHHAGVPDQRRGGVEVGLGGVDERARGVDDLAQARAGVLERRTRLGDHGAQVGLRHRLHQVVEVGEDLGRRHRDLGLRRVDRRAVLEVGPVVGLGLELDVLLADRRLVADQGHGLRRDLVAALVDRQQHVDTLVGELHARDGADLDAAVGHLGAGEDAARLREVRVHGVGRVVEQPVEPCVAGTDERHPEQGDDDEDDELLLGACGDHRTSATPWKSIVPRPGSSPCAERSNGSSGRAFW